MAVLVRPNPTPKRQAPAPRPRPALRVVSSPAPARLPDGPEDRVLRAGGPQDRALYHCGCGARFSADVSASVSCPHCGGHQAW